ncbi:hypothetical protein FRC01_007390 [Tulasnella sp. 417]|nr:hypothetical protein FRC01_007390 [Tulasnella sp. 417]
MASQSPNHVHKDIPGRPNPETPSPIAGLPPELLSLVFRFSLPMVDPMQEQGDGEECWYYMTGIYTLRSISTRWRDVIDTTPSMWALISSSWPREAIKTALARSSTIPIIIHLGCEPVHHEITLVREYLSLINPHRSRWAAAVLSIPMPLLFEFFAAPMPQLHTLNLSFIHSRSNSPPPITPILVETLGNLEHVLLETRDYECGEALGLFTRLKTLVLSQIWSRCMTIDQIIQTISDNPFLENLVLDGLNIQVDDTSTESRTALAAPPQLRTFGVKGSVTHLYSLMTRLELPLSVEEVDIMALAAEYSWQRSESNASLWIHAMQPLSPILQRLHSEHDGSTIFLEDGNRCGWATNVGIGGFKFEISGLDHRLGLKCIGSLANELDCASGLPDLHLVLDSAFSAADLTLVALKTVKTLASIEIRIGRKNTRIDKLVELISRMLEDAQDDPIHFPSLHTLSIRGRESDLDELADKLQQRYSDNPPRPPFQLLLDVTISD